MNWKTIKHAKMESLYPSPDSDITDIETLRGALEQFVQSPRNRNRKSTQEILKPVNWLRNIPHSHEEELNEEESPFHLVTHHGFGINAFQTIMQFINLKRFDLTKVIHSFITHPEAPKKDNTSDDSVNNSV